MNKNMASKGYVISDRMVYKHEVIWKCEQYCITDISRSFKQCVSEKVNIFSTPPVMVSVIHCFETVALAALQKNARNGQMFLVQHPDGNEYNFSGIHVTLSTFNTFIVKYTTYSYIIQTVLVCK